MDDSFDLEMAAASLRADGNDVGVLVRALIEQLSDALGPRLIVEREHGHRRRPGEVRELRIVLGDDEYHAEIEGPVLHCSIARSSGGIRIRSQRVEVDEWLQRLLRALQDEAQHSQSVRQALEHLVIGGST